MDRRAFLKDSTLAALSVAAGNGLRCGFGGLRLMAAEAPTGTPNPNWVALEFKAKATASSSYGDPPGGYAPENVGGDNLFTGWEADQQAAGAWLQIDFPESRQVSELLILAQPLPRDIVGQDVYSMTYSRVALLEGPRKLTCSFSDHTSIPIELGQHGYFEIITLPKTVTTSFVRLNVDEVWTKPGGKETGLGKLRIYPRVHPCTFEIDVYKQYDVREGVPVQSATLHLINPGNEIRDAQLVISQAGKEVMRFPLQPVPARSLTDQDAWIPAPFEPTAMDFELVAGNSSVTPKRSLKVEPYQSYFDNGMFALHCTCHNDLGWLNTQAKTADFRSSDIILPALKLLKKYPEFVYTMESTTYLMEFLERHPELRDEMVERMREGRFRWGASYIQCQEVHVGPEKLVRQFYLGRLWLKTNFPGVDTSFYFKTDPPSMTLQMPQILAKAGIKYVIQGRMPFGYYKWEAPDGSEVFIYAQHYVDPMRLLDPLDRRGWLRFADQRQAYYQAHQLPPQFMYDYTSDYLPPQPALPPYASEQNQAMKRFATAWNAHFQSQPERQIHPPEVTFVSAEGFLDNFTKLSLDITTLRGDWPYAWTYYDEPGNREALLAGRIAHNQLLAAERLCAGLGLAAGLANYPVSGLAEGWQANCWPDHGWGGNQGLLTDAVYHKSYFKSKELSQKLLSDAGAALAAGVKRNTPAQIPVVVFNSLSWRRADLVQCEVKLPASWSGAALRDEAGSSIDLEIIPPKSTGDPVKLVFLAEDVPSTGYRTYYLEQAAAASPTPISGNTVENRFFRVTLGKAGLKSLYDKQQKWEVLRTDKFEGGEVLEFTAPGLAWEDPEIVTMANFDRTGNHPFPVHSFTRSVVRSTAVREAAFKNFKLRESFHLYHGLARLDIETELLGWDGQKDRELRVVFPINLDDARLSYEVPFGTVEIGKDELDFTLLPPDVDTQFVPRIYGGDAPLRFREAVNWVDASSRGYQKAGCLAAADCTVHLFRDETTGPVSYPVLQHVLLSTRKSLAWNPDYWFTQAGDHRYRAALMPHQGDWRLRYRDAIAFNYPLVAFVGEQQQAPAGEVLPVAQSFLRLEPSNLILTAMKKSEDGNQVVLRFYEAEGNQTDARLQLSRPIRSAWRASLIEENQGALPLNNDGSLSLKIQPWEIATLKLAV
ncbi:MAG TPA: glycosyl hydrolase-related protein [Terriglobia bacterium]|nr:glycosyl hydrolase-related protein [Terriglobia bacterium]